MFFIGIDADPSRMRGASLRGTSALFVVAAAEAPPCELAGRAAEVTVIFPWGSLLRGVLGHDGAVLAGIAHLAAPRAVIRSLVSVTGRDTAAPAGALHDAAAIRRAYEPHGLTIQELRIATRAEVQASHSSWAKRLGAGTPARPAWLVTALKDGAQNSSPGGGGWHAGQ